MLNNKMMRVFQDHGQDIHKAVQHLKLPIKTKISPKIIRKKENKNRKKNQSKKRKKESLGNF